MNTPPEALLVLDMQEPNLNRLTAANEVTAKEVMGTVASAIAFARTKGIPVIYLRAGFRKGAPEISANNKFLAANQAMLADVNPEDFLRIAAAVAPMPADIVVDRSRISGFAGSDLEIVLRAKNIQHLVLAGVSTSGVVLSTVREASDKDYQLTVLSDACADVDDEIHRVLITKVFPVQADVLSLEEWMATLES